MNNQCRSCGHSNLEQVLSLGNTPLANALLTREQWGQPEHTYPLNLAFCPNCSLVQILETVAPEVLFRDYLYFSSFSDTTLKHTKDIVSRMLNTRNLSTNSLVVEIASNDGYLLRYFEEKQIPVLGIEPARNIAKVAEENGIRTLCEFFSNTLAQQLKDTGKQADIVFANNVLAHVANLNDVVTGIQTMLKENGVAIIEVPYIKDMIDNCEFDTIYHEHLCYFSATALDQLFKRHDMVVNMIERIPIHGGSLRLFVTHLSENNPNSIEEFLIEEAGWGVNNLAFYQNFTNKVNELRQRLLNLLQGLKGSGKSIAAYGAAAKGSTLLNYFGIGLETIDFVVDRSTYKQGHYMPGTHQPIYAPVKLLEEMPDYILLLTWNFSEEILAQQNEYRKRGGKFIIPIPEVHVV
ncbi:class I SAM-dependent methyltransferase [Chloroflexota bacterium]